MKKKYNELILLVHPLWNLIYLNDNNIEDIKRFLKTEKGRIQLKSQITTYTNTIKNRLKRNPRAYAIIVFPNKVAARELLSMGNPQYTELYWEVLETPFRKKIKELKNIEISNWHPNKEQDVFYFLNNVSSSEFEPNMKITAFGEQFKKTNGKEKGCVTQWVHKLKAELKKNYSKKSNYRIIENATLDEKHLFKERIQKLNKAQNKKPSRHFL